MFSKKGFTLVELMIVIAIIGILATALFPSMTRYMATARDSSRATDTRNLSTIFQVYRNVNEVFPDNFSGSLSYCTSDILGWQNGVGKDKQYEELRTNFSLLPKEKSISVPMSPCTQTGSYFYNRLVDAASTQYGIIAARMETNNNITYLTGSDFTVSANILKIMQATSIKNVDISVLPSGQAPIYHIIIN